MRVNREAVLGLFAASPEELGVCAPETLRSVDACAVHEVASCPVACLDSIDEGRLAEARERAAARMPVWRGEAR